MRSEAFRGISLGSQRVYVTSRGSEDVALFGQLCLLQCHILEKVWECLFPKYCAEAHGIAFQLALEVRQWYSVRIHSGAK